MNAIHLSVEKGVKIKTNLNVCKSYGNQSGNNIYVHGYKLNGKLPTALCFWFWCKIDTL